MDFRIVNRYLEMFAFEKLKYFWLQASRHPEREEEKEPMNTTNQAIYASFAWK